MQMKVGAFDSFVCVPCAGPGQSHPRGHKSETTLTADSELYSVDSPGTRDKSNQIKSKDFIVPNTLSVYGPVLQ